MLQFYAATPERLSGKQIPVAGGLDVTFHEPIGVVGVITPWNFPMPIASWGFAPALAAGNAVLLKPAEWTPLTSIRLGELAVEAGLPPDLFQVLPGKGSVVGERFVTHPDVRKIVFTGSTEVGTRVMAGAAGRSNGSPWSWAARAPTSSSTTATWSAPPPPHPTGCSTTPARTAAPAAGSWCSAVYSTGSWRLLEPAVKGVVVGDPADRDTEMGPLVSRKHLESVAGLRPRRRAGSVPRIGAPRARTTGSRRRC